MSSFKSAEEFREVMDRTFALMSDDPEMGPQLREADTAQRFEFTDLEMVVNIRAGGPEEPNLAWEWSDRRRLGTEGQNGDELGDRQPVLSGPGEHRDRDRAAADQGRRRCQSGADDHPDHKAAVRPLPAQ